MNDRTVGQDMLYYLPRWVAVAIVTTIVFGGSLHSVGPDGVAESNLHVIFMRRIPTGIGLGMLAGGIFIALQRLWNFESSQGKWWASLVSAAVIARLFFFAVGSLSAQSSQSPAAQLVDAEKQMEANAKKNHPGMNYSAAMKNEAAKMNTAMLSGSQTDKEKQEYALSNFFGFYFVNTNSRSAYCESQGVAIPAYVAAFKAANAEPYGLASRALSKYDDTEDHLYSQLGPGLTELNRKNIEDIATRSRVTPAAVCQNMQDYPETHANKVVFAQVQPDVMQVLRSTAR